MEIQRGENSVTFYLVFNLYFFNLLTSIGYSVGFLE